LNLRPPGYEPKRARPALSPHIPQSAADQRKHILAVRRRPTQSVHASGFSAAIRRPWHVRRACMLLHTLAGTRLQKIARGPSRPVTEYPWRRPGRMACLVAAPRRPLRPTWATSLRAARIVRSGVAAAVVRDRRATRRAVRGWRPGPRPGRLWQIVPVRLILHRRIGGFPRPACRARYRRRRRAPRRLHHLLHRDVRNRRARRRPCHRSRHQQPHRPDRLGDSRNPWLGLGAA
jgi:hypothetical protein